MTFEVLLYSASLAVCLYLMLGTAWRFPLAPAPARSVETEAQQHRRHIETALAQAETARTFAGVGRQS